MFKRIINIAFALFFTITATGLIIQENFCYSKLVSIFIEKTSEKCCNIPCPGCHKRIIIIKVYDNFINTVKKQIPEKLTLKCAYILCIRTDFIRYGMEERSNDFYNLFSRFQLALTISQLMVFRC
jgi:hypothetical protein